MVESVALTQVAADADGRTGRCDEQGRSWATFIAAEEEEQLTYQYNWQPNLLCDE